MCMPKHAVFLRVDACLQRMSHQSQLTQPGERVDDGVADCRLLHLLFLAAIACKALQLLLEWHCAKLKRCLRMVL